MAGWQKMTPEIAEVLNSARSANCICGDKPCHCNNGWGYFEKESDLLAAISSEIRSEEDRLHGYSADPDVEAVEWMWIEGALTEQEIAESLGISERRVKTILRQLDL